MKTENVVTRWKKYADLKKAVYRFTGANSRFMRTMVGNFNGIITNAPWETPGTQRRILKQNMNIIMNKLKSRKVNTPTLYKGLSGNNAKNFKKYIQLKNRGLVKNVLFHTRAPTSTSTNRFQARAFAAHNNPIILVIPANKRHALILGQNGIKSRQPREKEVILPPGTFIVRNKNKDGGYIVNFKNLI